MTLDAKTEFDDVKPAGDGVADEPAVKAGDRAAAGVTREDLEALAAHLGEQIETTKGLSVEAVAEKLRTALGGGVNESPKDKFVREELLRLVPGLKDLDQIRQIMPMLLATMEATVEERNTEKAMAAQEHMKGLIKGLGLDADDQEVIDYMEEALTREIRGNKELLGLWARGRTKEVVSKAFDKVQSKLFAPLRVKGKRDAVSTITDAPKASPRGGAVPGASDAGVKKPQLDLTDTSSGARNKVHDAAFEWLQERLTS